MHWRIALACTSVFIAGFFMAGSARSKPFDLCADAKSSPDLNGSLCAVIDAPLRAPGSKTGGAPGTIHLFVRKFPAIGPAKGAVWLVAGGPGESGATFYPLIAKLRASFPGFDLLIPDHRGTGFSTRLCPKEEAPDSPGGAALDGAEWGSCFGQLNAAPDYARAFSTTNAARDLGQLIAETHEPGPVYLYGVSYGTTLALRLLLVEQPRLAGVILDSLTWPEASKEWDLSHRSQVVDKVGREILRRCDETPACHARFPAGIEQAYTAFLASKNKPAAVPPGDLKIFFGSLLDFPETRARIPDLIAELPNGDTHTLDAVKLTLDRIGARLGGYPQSPPSVPLVSIITASEENARPDLTKQQVEQEEAGLLFASSIPGYLVDPGLPTYARDDYFGRSAAKLPPILVLQGSLDPKAPFEGAKARVAEFGAAGAITFIRVEDAPHFVLLNAPDCFEQAAGEFLATPLKVTAPDCRTASIHSAF